MSTKTTFLPRLSHNDLYVRLQISSKLDTNPHFEELSQKSVCKVHMSNEKDAMTSHYLDRNEVQCAPWRMHSSTGQPVETQDKFLLC